MKGNEKIKKKLLESIRSVEKPDREILDFLQNYNGDDEMIKGAKAFLEDKNWDFSLLQSTIKNLPDIEVPKKNKLSFLMKVAAILIFVLGTVLFLCSKSSNHAQVIEEGLPVFMGEYSTTYNEFMNEYRLANYENAISIGSMIKQKSDTLNFYMGCSYIYSGNYNQAIEQLNRINKSEHFEESKNFQLAYAYFKIGRTNEALKFIEKIKKSTNQKYTSAVQELLKNLD